MLNLQRKLRTFRLLSSDDRSLIVQVLSVSVAISCGFRVLGVARSQALLRRWATSGNGDRTHPPTQADISAVLRAQSIVRKSSIEGTCLVRSFTLWALLSKRGCNTDLRIGFRKGQNGQEGHAWVELKGVPLNETPEVVKTYCVCAEEVGFDTWRNDRRT